MRPLLIPIVLEKIPNVIRLQISRKLGRENWNKEEFIKCINEEISARQHFQYIKKQEEYVGKTDYAASALTVASTENDKICIFCENNHYSDRCSTVTDLDVSKSILRKKRRCSRCLRANHMAKFCRVSVKCYKCKMVKWIIIPRFAVGTKATGRQKTGT